MPFLGRKAKPENKMKPNFSKKKKKLSWENSSFLLVELFS